MAAIPIGLAVVGAGTQIAGTIMGANAQSEAAQKSAALKRLQAQELLKREAQNELILQENGVKLENQFSTAFAATGGGGGLGGVLEIHRQVQQNILTAREDANFKAQMLNAGADVETSLASDTMAASYVTGAGTVLGLGAKFWDVYGKYSGNQTLPKVPS